MVATLVGGLLHDAEIEVLHVNVRLSRDGADVGRWRAGKLLPLLAACVRALRLRLGRGPCIFYYVPAPGKRSALWRDFFVLLVCRPFFQKLVLHWHAVGLGAWLESHATAPERLLAGWLLGRADLAIVLAPELSADARRFSPLRVAVVPNCVPDPAPEVTKSSPPGDDRCNVFFLGQCSRAKGLFDTLEAVVVAERAAPGAYRLTVAGGFASADEEREFRARVANLPPGLVTHVGFAEDAQKQALFAAADVFCFPTAYPHEGQPLVLIEALAHDVPIITTRWRAIPGMLPSAHVWFVAPGQPAQIAAALSSARSAPRPNGALRRHYLARFTPERHLAAIKTALL